jgi:hypothetical protein
MTTLRLRQVSLYSIGVHGNVILKRVLNRVGRMDWIHVAQDRVVTDCGNEFLDSVRGGEYFEYLRGCSLLRAVVLHGVKLHVLGSLQS